MDAVAAATRARVLAAGLGEITRLVVHLSPEDLGPVRITAEQTSQGVQVELAGGDETVREALRTSLDDLRQQLDAGSGGRQDPRDTGRWGAGGDADGRRAPRP
ncbi:flagellar hook-length control protein FliK, partial [Aquipuribacter hungaricus]